MKKLFMLLSLVLCLCLLGGCMGTPVIYHENCDCPTQGGNTPTQGGKPVVEGAVKTGLAVVTDITGSKDGEAKYDVTLVAVLVDDNGVILDCIIDGISTSVKYGGNFQIETDLTAPVKTKNELGNSYGMGVISSIKKEWNEQAQALADFAVGKTVAELKNGAIDETGKAPAGTDLASSATIYLGGYVAAIEKAVLSAAHLGARGGDSLKLATMASLGCDTTGSGIKYDTITLNADVTALTMADGVITSCIIDSVQAKVDFANSELISDLSKPVQTKNELGSNYGMVAYGHAKYEWNQQAAAFAAYVTGKTPAQVAGIAVSDSSKPADTDLAASVTIAIGGFQALIAKAAQ